MSEQITIKVKTLEQKQLELKVNKDISIVELKELVAKQSNLPVEKQRLIFQGKVLKNDHNLNNYDVKDGSIIHLVTMPGATRPTSTPQPSAPTVTSTVPPTSSAPPTLPQTGSTRVATFSFPTGQGAPDLNSIMGSVFNSMGIPPQNQPIINVPQPVQQPVQQPQQTSPQSLLNTIRSFDFTRVSRLESLLSREAFLSNDERQEVQRITQDLTTVVGTLAPQLNVTSQTNTQQQRPSVSGISVHVHATPNELDALPDQLARLQQRIDVQQQQRQQVRHLGSPTQGTPVGATITIVSDQQQVPQSIIQNMQRNRQQQQPQQQPQQPPAPQNPQGGFDFGQILQSAMPFVQNLIGGQNQGGQQGGNPFSGLFQAPQQQQQPPQNQGLNVNMGTFVNNMASSLGIQNQPTSPLDNLFRAAISNLQLTDIMGLANGNWAALEATRAPLQKHLEEEVLKGDTSPQARSAAIEKALEHIKTESRNDQELMNALKQRVRSEQELDTLIETAIEISRTYFSAGLDVVLDGPTTAQRVHPNVLRVPVGDNQYSTALKQLLNLFCGEILDLMNNSFINPTDSNAVVGMLSQRLMSGLPENLGHLTAMGANMFVGFVNRNYLIYKQEQPNRQPTRTRAPHATTTVAPTTPTTPIIPAFTAPQQQEAPKPVSPAPVSSPAPAPQPITTPAPQQARVAPTRPTQQPWYQGLSEEERKMMEDTIKEDEQKMRLPPSSVKSEAYSGKKPNNQTVEEDVGDDEPGLEDDGDDQYEVDEDLD